MCRKRSVVLGKHFKLPQRILTSIRVVLARLVAFVVRMFLRFVGDDLGHMLSSVCFPVLHQRPAFSVFALFLIVRDDIHDPIGNTSFGWQR